jgi:hypothetical protein
MAPRPKTFLRRCPLLSRRRPHAAEQGLRVHDDAGDPERPSPGLASGGGLDAGPGRMHPRPAAGQPAPVVDRDPRGGRHHAYELGDGCGPSAADTRPLGKSHSLTVAESTPTKPPARTQPSPRQPLCDGRHRSHRPRETEAAIAEDHPFHRWTRHLRRCRVLVSQEPCLSPTATSGRMSMRHPVSRAASRAF